jgi:tRNA-splicing ligase RtcB
MDPSTSEGTDFSDDFAPRTRRDRGPKPKQELSPIFECVTAPDVVDRDLRKTINAIRGSDDVAKVIVMPDIHAGKAFPNGVAIATRELIYPLAVGSDIGCGMAVARFNCSASSIDQAAADVLLAALPVAVPALIRRSEHANTIPEELLKMELRGRGLESEKGRDARLQLGTLGRGNHFVELQRDEDDNLWVMVHTGSRAMGPMITSCHLKNAEESKTGLPYLNVNTPAGQDYINDMRWAMRYATLNRLAILGAVGDTLKAALDIDMDRQSTLEMPHNFAQVEVHSGESLWVHRKSVLSAKHGEIGIVPGSMAAPSFIVEGLGNPDALNCAAHGAGRDMSRGEAGSKVKTEELLAQTEHVFFDRNKARDLREEAPEAYRDIGKVMRAMRKAELVKQVRKFEPVLSYKVP